jgi:hypothetical protein
VPFSAEAWGYMPCGQAAGVPDGWLRGYRALMKAKWRRDVLATQQVGLPQVVGLLLVGALLSPMAMPSPYGFVVSGVALTLLAVLLHRNARRRRRGIEGWPNAVVLAPFLITTVLVAVAHLVSELLAGVLFVALVVVGLVLLVRRLRRAT